MNLYIASIKLWFKGFRENTERSITYSFEPNKINVITGDSSTGKSSILDIIDYLLLSDNPTIVENIINENVEYYGMNIFLEERSYILYEEGTSFRTRYARCVLEGARGISYAIHTNSLCG